MRAFTLTAIALAAALVLLIVPAITSVAFADGGKPYEPPPAPLTRLKVPHPATDCRYEPYYPSARAKVHCVLRWNGMLWSRNVADCIIDHESGWDVDARGSAGEYGLWQIHPVNWTYLDRYGGAWWDPVTNTAAAIALYRANGYSFGAWAAYRAYCS